MMYQLSVKKLIKKKKNVHAYLWYQFKYELPLLLHSSCCMENYTIGSGSRYTSYISGIPTVQMCDVQVGHFVTVNKTILSKANAFLTRLSSGT